MEYALLGFFTGLSLILAIGAQNIFVIEQGLKKQHVFLVCLICSVSDLILIFLGIFLFHYFNQYFNQTVELIFNILLILFLLHFIYVKIKKIRFYSFTSPSPYKKKALSQGFFSFNKFYKNYLEATSINCLSL